MAPNLVAPADDDMQPDDLTIHGLLRTHPRELTVVGAETTWRRGQILAGGAISDPGEQTLQAAYVLLGGHLDGANAVFTEARPNERARL